MQLSLNRKLLQVLEQNSISILVILSLLMWLISLGNIPLKDWDEGTYALIAREIIRTGDWTYLKIQGDPFLLKPPLGMWAIAVAYQIGGINEFMTRLPCAILTAIGIPVLYQISYLLFERKTPALLSALVYLTLLPVVRHGRLAMFRWNVNYLLAIITTMSASILSGSAMEYWNWINARTNYPD
jgi:4-amino-4-deoxy-L-arabinose transferase-like glycosyltransferase